MRYFLLLALLAISAPPPATADAMLKKDACREVRYQEIASCYSAQTQRLERMIDVVIQSYKDEIESRPENHKNVSVQLIESKARFSDYKQAITNALYTYETGSIKRINAAAMVNSLTWEYFYHLLNFRCANHLNVRIVSTYDLNQPETWCGQE